MFLWRPKEVVNDLWRASSPELPANTDRAEWGERVPPALLRAWWAMWLVAILGDRVAARLGAATLAEARTAAWWILAAALVTAVAAVLAARVVRVVTDGRRARAERLGKLRTAELAAAPERPL